ncbi:MAG: hypothetical protein QOH72_2492 [Solirubrobacteraceae bacterium]|jgi:hypothetical protein|nr:hypothetical protein [Solirubrobacteraceae bacterium]
MNGIEYQETAVGRLPVGPAADAALAAAAVGAPERSSADVPEVGAAARGAPLKRLAPALAAGLAIAIAIAVWRRSS